MYSFETTIFIDRPPQEVFDYMNNPANTPKWQGNLVSAEITSEGPTGVGTTQRAVGQMLGRKFDVKTEITTWDPPNKITNKTLDGPVQFEATTRYDSKESGTQVTLNVTAEVGGFFKLAEGLVAKQAQKQFETNYSALKMLLEADSM
jgi:uncharacterized protein YndB with AHSA1/START domain